MSSPSVVFLLFKFLFFWGHEGGVPPHSFFLSILSLSLLRCRLPAPRDERRGGETTRQGKKCRLAMRKWGYQAKLMMIAVQAAYDVRRKA